MLLRSLASKAMRPRLGCGMGRLGVLGAAQPEKIHLFVFKLGYSHRLHARAYRNEQLTTQFARLSIAER